MAPDPAEQVANTHFAPHKRASDLIGVGLCAAAIGYTGYLKSLAYSHDRLQGRPIGADASAPKMPTPGTSQPHCSGCSRRS